MAREGMDLNNLDKSNWQTYRFDQIARNISERINPNNTDLEVYIGLEHIDSDSIHIKRSGTPDDVNGQKLRFYPGDVIFGRRRAYQRKAAIANMDGFCSAHSLVLRANPNVIDPKLFPFFLHSDSFMHRAIDISVGSLSPTINWGTLKHQEFLLPTKNQQARLAELLWAMDELIEKDISVIEQLNIALNVRSSDSIWNQGHELKNLVSFSDSKIKKLIDGDWIESKDQSESGIRLLQLADIGLRTFINKSSRFISAETFNSLKCFEVLPGDVLIARMPEPIGRACIVENIGVRMIMAVDCCVARVDTSHSNSKYLMFLLNSRDFLQKANSLASGTTRQRISRTNIESIKVPKPDLVTQKTIADSLDLIFSSISEAQTKLESSKNLQKSLTNQIF